LRTSPHAALAFIGFHLYSGGLLRCWRSCQDVTESHHLIYSIVQKARTMPKIDAMRLIHDTRRGVAGDATPDCLFVELFYHSLNLLTLQRKERRDDDSGIRKQVLLFDYMK
jgi:hypothetical protein